MIMRLSIIRDQIRNTQMRKCCWKWTQKTNIELEQRNRWKEASFTSVSRSEDEMEEMVGEEAGGSKSLAGSSIFDYFFVRFFMKGRIWDLGGFWVWKSYWFCVRICILAVALIGKMVKRERWEKKERGFCVGNDWCFCLLYRWGSFHVFPLMFLLGFNFLYDLSIVSLSPLIFQFISIFVKSLSRLKNMNDKC